MATQAGGSVTSRAASESRSGAPGSSNAPGNTAQTATGAKFRHGLLQLMIHTIDPLHDGKVHRTLLLFHKSFLNFFVWFSLVCVYFIFLLRSQPYRFFS